MDFMQKAYELALASERRGDVPVGAVITRNGKIIATGLNRRQKTRMATAHAEILAIEKACRRLKSWRLSDCEIYVSLEPCVMCAGAILNARIAKLYIGCLADNKKTGARGEALGLFSENNLNWKTEVVIDEREELKTLIKEFFSKKRD
ncbi:MAG: nucleoside deaminase [Christensenellaceae bacterium]|jgi:tRNA(adenine34) deaminase|nr:nucleoside deaminase [Christensenellaceae bacterium]